MIRIRPRTPSAQTIAKRPLRALAAALLCGAALVLTAPLHPVQADEGRIPVVKPVPPEPRVLTREEADVLNRLMDTVRARGWSAAEPMLGQIRNPMARKVVRWMRLQARSGGGSFEDIARFADANPHWPRRDRLLHRAEQAITADMPPARVIQWFGGRDPLTGDGMVRLGAAHIATNRTAIGAAWIRRAWREAALSRDVENLVRRRFLSHLRTADHDARLDMLVWDGKSSAARRMKSSVSQSAWALADARLRLRGNRRGVDAAIARVPASAQDDPGLVYERVRWRRRRDMDRDTWDLLKNAPNTADGMERPDRWWIERRIQTRHALTKNKPNLAYRFVRHHGLERGGSFADAEWKAGWIALQFLDTPANARAHFTKLNENVSFPISKARAQYWLGRTAERDGRSGDALMHYGQAAAHNTTFYGQLAIEQLDGGDPFLRLPATPLLDPATRNAFRERELARAMAVSSDFAPDWVTRDLLLSLVEDAASAQDFALAAAFALDLDLVHLSVRLSKKAAQAGHPITDYAYPMIDLPPYLGQGEEPERAFVMALIRQETEFDHDAISHANARGLMQLVPATARTTARRHGLVYKRAWLTSKPDYNSQLGRAHLSDLLKEFDGSYILTAAAYNAGKARAHQWVREFGDPRDPSVDAVDWIERIPFSETRNYVQRILETTAVYRNRLTGKDHRVMLSADIKRSATLTPSLVAEAGANRSVAAPRPVPGRTRMPPSAVQRDVPPAQTVAPQPAMPPLLNTPAEDTVPLPVAVPGTLQRDAQAPEDSRLPVPAPLRSPKTRMVKANGPVPYPGRAAFGLRNVLPVQAPARVNASASLPVLRLNRADD